MPLPLRLKREDRVVVEWLSEWLSIDHAWRLGSNGDLCTTIASDGHA